MNKTNWLRMESRIREQLKKANETMDFSQIIVRIDEIIASETGRGNSLLQDKAVILSGSEDKYDSLSSEEWNKVD